MAISTITNNSIDAAAAIATSKLGAGAILQVAQASNPGSTGISTTSTSLVASGITVSITPKKASSLIRVDWVCSMCYGSNAMVIQIFSNGATIGSYSGGYTGGGIYAPLSATAYFSPGTTSAQTYAIYFYSTGGAIVYLVHPGALYALTATEIAA